MAEGGEEPLPFQDGTEEQGGQNYMGEGLSVEARLRTAAALPQVPVPGTEEERVAERIKCRTKATNLCTEFENLRRTESTDPDELAWLLQRADELIHRLTALQIAGENDPKSQHLNQLQAVMFKGTRLLTHLESLRDARVHAVAGSATQLHSTTELRADHTRLTKQSGSRQPMHPVPAFLTNDKA